MVLRRADLPRAVCVLLTALMTTLVVLLPAPPSVAAGTGAEIGMPFTGWWDRFGYSHPSSHRLPGATNADWSTDLYQAAGTAVRPRMTGPGLALKVASVTSTCGSGHTVEIDVHTNGQWVGKVRYGHLASVQVSANEWISTDRVLGYLHQWPKNPGCWEVNYANGVHTHFSGYNLAQYSCYYNMGSGAYLGDGTAIGIVGGAYATGPDQACNGRPAPPATPPGAPGTPACTPTDTGTVQAWWSGAAANGAAIEEYQVSWRNEVTGGLFEPSAGNATSHTFNGGALGQPHTVSARARNSQGWGPWSARSPGCTPRTAPGEPGDPNASVTGTSVHLAWSPSDPRGDGVAEYEVQAEDVDDGTSSTLSAGQATAVDVTPPLATHAYRYRVRARNAAGWGGYSAWSSTVEVHDDDAPVLALTSPGDEPVTAPLDIRGTATDRTGVSRVDVVVYSLSARAFLRPGGELGDVYRFPAVVESAADPTAAGWSVGITAIPDGRYEIRVMGRDAVGNQSSPRAVGRFDVGVPDTVGPVLRLTSPTPDSVASMPLRVVGRATDASGVAGVDVLLQNLATQTYVQPDGTLGPLTRLPARLVDPNSTATTWVLRLATLPAGRYRVDTLSRDTLGNATRVRHHQFHIGSPDVVPPAVIVAAPEGGSEVEPPLAVTGSATDASGVRSVSVRLLNRDTGTYLHADGTLGDVEALPALLASPRALSTPFELSGLPAPDGRYTLFVQGVDVFGTRSSWQRSSTFKVLTTVTPPGVPGAPTASSGENRQSTVQWAPPLSDGGAPVTSYDLRRHDGEIRSTTATPYTWTGLQNGLGYTFSVRACNVRGCGEWSAPSGAATPFTTPDGMAAPGVWSQNNAIRVAWGTPGNGGSPITRFEVTGGSSAATSANEVVFGYGQDGSPRSYAVRACNSAGCGPWSGGSAAVRPFTIQLARGGGAPSGYWYDTTVTGAPGASMTLACHDGRDLNFYTQAITLDAGGYYRDSTLCYSGDLNPHWVTAGSLSSNQVGF